MTRKKSRMVASHNSPLSSNKLSYVVEKILSHVLDQVSTGAGSLF